MVIFDARACAVAPATTPCRSGHPRHAQLLASLAVARNALGRFAAPYLARADNRAGVINKNDGQRNDRVLHPHARLRLMSPAGRASRYWHEAALHYLRRVGHLHHNGVPGDAQRDSMVSRRGRCDREEGRLCFIRAGDVSENHHERESSRARAGRLEPVHREPSGRNDRAGEGVDLAVIERG